MRIASIVHVFLDFCPAPPDITNTVLLKEVSQIVNSILIYGCKEGFARVGGSNYLKCVEVDGKGVWIGDLLKCEEHANTGIVNAVTLFTFECHTQRI